MANVGHRLFCSLDGILLLLMLLLGEIQLCFLFFFAAFGCFQFALLFLQLLVQLLQGMLHLLDLAELALPAAELLAQNGKMAMFCQPGLQDLQFVMRRYVLQPGVLSQPCCNGIGLPVGDNGLLLAIRQCDLYFVQRTSGLIPSCLRVLPSLIDGAHPLGWLALLQALQFGFGFIQCIPGDLLALSGLHGCLLGLGQLMTPLTQSLRQHLLGLQLSQLLSQRVDLQPHVLPPFFR